MTNTNAALANDTPRPVSRHENKMVQGMALSCDRVHKFGLDKIEALRERERGYRASLPTDPQAGCEAVRRAFEDFGDHDSPVAIAKANFIILREVMLHCDVEGSPDLVESLALLAEQGIDAMAKVHNEIKLASDSAANALGIT